MGAAPMRGVPGAELLLAAARSACAAAPAGRCSACSLPGTPRPCRVACWISSAW